MKNLKTFNEHSTENMINILSQIEFYEPLFKYYSKEFYDNYISENDFEILLTFKLKEEDFDLINKDLNKNYDKYHNHFEEFITKNGLDKYGRNDGVLTRPEENEVVFSFENYDFRR